MYRYYLSFCMLLLAGGLRANGSYPDLERHPNARLLPENCGVFDERHPSSEAATASINEYPWMTLISYEKNSGQKNFLCTGTIINSRYILTAANCVQNKRVAGVRVGDYDTCKASDCQDGDCEWHFQDILVEEEIVHKEYEAKNQQVHNNIALLRLKEPIDFSFKNMAPICLPVSNSMRDVSLSGQSATLVSWKLRQHDTCVPLKVILPLIARDQCNEKYKAATETKGRISEDQICADERDQSACGIGSGDPLMLMAETPKGNRIAQYGISSHGPVRCGSELPGVYTNVIEHMAWILDNIKE